MTQFLIDNGTSNLTSMVNLCKIGRGFDDGSQPFPTENQPNLNKILVEY